MPIDAETRGAVAKKGRLFDAAKNKIEERIRSNVRMAIGKLQSAERELLDEVEIEFGENPFSYFLSVDDHTEEEVQSILSKEIPRNFGPSEESFCSLLKEIESFKSWERKTKRMLLDLIPQNLKCADITWDSIIISWGCVKFDSDSLFEIELRSSATKTVYHSTKMEYTFTGLKSGTKYHIRVRTITSQNANYWSDSIEAQTKERPFAWKKCPGHVFDKRRYSLDEKNFRIATMKGNEWCTIIGDKFLPPNKVTSWSITLLKSKYNNGGCVYIGVAPSDINQNKNDNLNKCGWYFGCYSSSLYSGPPHNFTGKEYGPRKEDGEYVHAGDSVGVVMDTAKGELSFALDGVNLCVAYEGIPLDKPLVPCVLLGYEGDSVEFDSSEAKENVVDSSIPVPSNITAKSITKDSIILTWDTVERASFYQIEVDGNKFWDVSTTNAFTAKGFSPETEHTFRVRSVRGNKVSEWSDVVKGKTRKETSYISKWKECPGHVFDKNRYSLDEKRAKIASMEGSEWCTIIGSKHLSLNKVITWRIKLLKSKYNNGGCVYIGVAPSDITQYIDENFWKRGWYFSCYLSTLNSGPPHNYKCKEYGPRKKEGQYVRTGDSVGVVMDTAKGELSFALDGVNLGVAYEGIPTRQASGALCPSRV